MTMSALLFAGLIQTTVTLPAARAEMVKVHYIEGTQHGYLALRTEDGKRIATGELSQVVEGDHVRVRLVYRFLDGSVDDERALFTQKGTFRLLSDRHIQRGPSFPQPYDIAIDVAKNEVVTRPVGDKKRSATKPETKAETRTMSMPEDLANGSILTILKNLNTTADPHAEPIALSYLGALPKPRLVRLAITSSSEDSFRVGSLRRKARCFVIKINLGGMAGVVAPLIGKQPGDIRVWIEEGEAPAFVREEGAFYQGGPVWITEMVSPNWGS